MKFDLGVIASSALKSDEPRRARELYLGDLFLKSRALVERVCRQWLIISPRHGVVHPDDELEPYDFRELRPEAFMPWSMMVTRHLREATLDATTVLMLVPEATTRNVVWPGGLTIYRPLFDTAPGSVKARIEELLGQRDVDVFHRLHMGQWPEVTR